jgi:tRNA G10  N-methylase Trm11
MYDPFAGTGSLLYAVAHWGAYVFGSDIDGRQMRGKSKSSHVELGADGVERGKGVTPGMLRSADQYGVRDQFLDLFTFDVTQNPLRRGGWIDAIVTDPPCKSTRLRSAKGNGGPADKLRRGSSRSKETWQKSDVKASATRRTLFDGGWNVFT